MAGTAQKQALVSERGREPNPLDSDGLCLLSLDGGGVRGLSSLFILKRLMARLNHERQAANLPPVRPYEVFDLIGGTSTGGLIAIMIGRLEMDIDECIMAYSELMRNVFDNKSSWLPVSLNFQTRSQFDSAKLETAITRVITSHCTSKSDLFNDRVERACRVFVCATAKETKGITRLRSYSVPEKADSPATICEAALATSAATTFFDPVSIGARKYVDGALGANNPVDEVESETSNIWCPETRDLKPLVKCFISVGTGNPGKKAIEDNMLKFLSKTLAEIATETETTANKFIERWAQHFDGKRYFRFNVHQGLQGVGLAEFQQQGTIEAVTDEYLDDQEQRFRVRDCVLNLMQKKKTTDTGFASVITEHNMNRIIQLRTTPSTSCWSVPFERNQRFIGRTSQLSELQAKLFAEDQFTKFAIFGLGGVGKTQVALELAFRMRDIYPECSIFWIPATNIENLQQAYLELGRQLQIPDVEDKHADIIKLVQHYLSQMNARQWLLIFDNADDINMWINKSVNTESPSLIDLLPKHSKGSILFTTRSRKIAVKLAKQSIIQVGTMDEDVATQMLSTYLIDKESLKDCQTKLNLLNQLEFLPLAIVQAAAYINENGINLSEYLTLLEDTEQNVIELLAEDFEEEGRYRDTKNPVATTWLISFKHILCHDPLAVGYLAFMSCLDPKKIPESILPLAKSKKRMTDAIGTLNAYSFITKRSTDQALDLHRLVHLAARNWLRMQNVLTVWTAKAVAQICQVFPTDDPKNRNIWRAYLPHVRYVLDSELTENGTEGRLQLLEKFGLCLLSDGRFDEAENPFLQVMEMRKRVLEQEHPVMLTSMSNLASTYLNQGRWKEAEELEMQVMETRKRVLGQEHLDTLEAMHKLASIYHKQGRWKEAEELKVQVMEMKKRVLGPEHPSMLVNMANLALTFGSQGRSKEAEELKVQVIEAQKRVLGQEHPNTLTVMANLASTYHDQGRWKEAKELGVQVMETQKRVLGQEHPDTLLSMANLSSIFRKQGKWKEAEELNVQVMETRKRVLGQEHPETLISMNNLATIFGDQGRSKEAEELKVQVVETQKRVLGPEHPDTLISMANLAFTYQKQGRLKEAEELNVQVMETKKRVLGPEHPFTLISMSNLAYLYQNQGQSKDAEELKVQVMETQKRVLGQEHPDTLNTMGDLASTYQNQRRWKEAEKLQVQVMETRKRVLGPEHPDTLTSMGDLASTFWNLERLKDAKELEVQVMETRKRVLGPEHPSTLTSMSNLASTYQNQERSKEAEELEVQVMETRKRVLGPEHPSTLTSMANLASTYQNQGRSKEAEELNVQVIETKKRVLGPEHLSTLISMGNLAFTYQNQGRSKEAEELKVQVMETQKRVLGQEHPVTLKTMSNVASTYQNQGRWKEAEELQVQVMETTKRVLGPEHPDTLISMGDLASTFWNQERLKEAEELNVQVMETRKRVLGPEHPSTLTSMGNLASTYQHQGRWKEAEELGVQVMETNKRVLGPQHPDTLTIMANLAFNWKSQGFNAKALELMTESCKLSELKLGLDHPRTISSLGTLDAWRMENLTLES